MTKTISKEYAGRWKLAAEAMGIPSEFYSGVKVRVVSDPSGKSDYSMGVVYNSGRSKRPMGAAGQVKCHMCRMRNDAEQDPVKNLFPEGSPPGYIVTPNGFPPSEGATMLIAKKDRPMYDTNNLVSAGELDSLFRFGASSGLKIYHQTVGAGATQGMHEHFHGTTLHKLQENIGICFGLDEAEKVKVPGVDGVYIMPGAEFAHLIFDETNPDKIVDFLGRVSSIIPSPLEDGSIPHTLSQGKDGKVLIAPLKVDAGRSMGSERAPGYFFVPTEEEFDSVTYDLAMKFMGERFFPKSIDLESIL